MSKENSPIEKPTSLKGNNEEEQQNTDTEGDRIDQNDVIPKIQDDSDVAQHDSNTQMIDNTPTSHTNTLHSSQDDIQSSLNDQNGVGSEGLWISRILDGRMTKITESRSDLIPPRPEEDRKESVSPPDTALQQSITPLAVTQPSIAPLYATQDNTRTLTSDTTTSDISSERTSRPTENAVSPALTQDSSQYSTGPEGLWVSRILDVHIIRTMESRPNVIPILPEEARRRSVAAPGVAKRQSVASPDVTRRQSVAAPGPPRRQSAAAPDVARRPSAAAPDVARRPSAAAPDVARRQSAAPSDAARRQSAAPQDMARRPSAAPSGVDRRQSAVSTAAQRKMSSTQEPRQTLAFFPEERRKSTTTPPPPNRKQSITPSGAGQSVTASAQQKKQSEAPTQERKPSIASTVQGRQSILSKKGVNYDIPTKRRQSTISEESEFNAGPRQNVAPKRASTVSSKSEGSVSRASTASVKFNQARSAQLAKGSVSAPMGASRRSSSESVASKADRASIKSTQSKNSSSQSEASGGFFSLGKDAAVARGTPPPRSGQLGRGAAAARGPAPGRGAPQARRGGRPPGRGYIGAAQGGRGTSNGTERSMFHSKMFPFAQKLAPPDSRRASAVSTMSSNEDRGDRRRRSSVVQSHMMAVKSLGSGRVMFIFMATCMFTTVIAFKLHFQSMIDHMSQRGDDEFGRRVLTMKALWTEKECPEQVKQRAWKGPFDWSPSVKRDLLRYYFWGYISSGIPAAILADQLSSKWVAFFALMINVFCSIFTPWFATFTSWEWLVFIFVCQGVGGGAFFPAIVTVISHWAPPKKRSTHTGIIFGGMALGKALAILLSYATANASYHFMLHFGVLACLPPALMWALWMESRPSESYYIHTAERLAIVASHAGTRVEQRDFPFPYGDIMASMPFWALFIVHFCANCLYVMVYYQVPAYIRDVLNIDIEAKMVHVFVPYVAMFGVSAGLGFLTDKLIAVKQDRLEKCRKLCAMAAVLGPLAFLVAIPSGECNLVTTSVLNGFAIACSGAQTVSILSNHLDIAPNFAGILFAITNTFATIPFLVMPSIMGSLLDINNRKNYPATYAISFYIVGLIALVGIIIFVIFGGTNVEPWNNWYTEEEEEEEDI